MNIFISSLVDPFGCYCEKILTDKFFMVPLYATIRPSNIVNWCNTKLYDFSGCGTDKFNIRVIIFGSTMVVFVGGYGIYSGKTMFPKFLKY